MKSPRVPLLLLLLNFLCFLPFLPPAITISASHDYTTLAYKTCANQTFTSESSASQPLFALFQVLVSQSSSSNFFNTIIAIDDFPAISGVYQCRGDLSPLDCQNCVKLLPELVTSLCENSIACRIQLSGCYIQYESDEFEFFGLDLRHKICSEPQLVNINKEVMEAVFLEVENGVLDGDKGGFYSVNNEFANVLAQCDGDLGRCDCGGCLGSATEIVLDECRSSLSGEVYMDGCFLSFELYANGVPSEEHPGNQRENNSSKTGKLVAIVVGAAAALGLGFIFILFIRSISNKKNDR